MTSMGANGKISPSNGFCKHSWNSFLPNGQMNRTTHFALRITMRNGFFNGTNAVHLTKQTETELRIHGINQK